MITEKNILFYALYLSVSANLFLSLYQSGYEHWCHGQTCRNSCCRAPSDTSGSLEAGKSLATAARVFMNWQTCPWPRVCSGAPRHCHLPVVTRSSSCKGAPSMFSTWPGGRCALSSLFSPGSLPALPPFVELCWSFVLPRFRGTVLICLHMELGLLWKKQYLNSPCVYSWRGRCNWSYGFVVDSLFESW